MKKKAETIEQFKILQWIEKTFQEDVICEIEWTSKTTAKLTGDTPTRVLANGQGFLRHGRTPQRAITSPLHPVTSLL